MNKLLAIGAGKGGVGKSTLTCQLALALTAQGMRVGILDADVYGPSIDLLMPFDRPPDVINQKLIPAQFRDIQLMSIAYFRKEAAIVRAPIANQTIERFLTGCSWDSLDYLLVDFPPGTGDVQLTLMQKAQFDAAILVTTPQDVALLDVEKAHSCFEHMRVPTLGLVENMSYFDHGGQRLFPLGEGGGDRLARQLGIPLLGKLPMDPRLSLPQPMPILEPTLQIAKQIFVHFTGENGLEQFEVIWRPEISKSVEERGGTGKRMARIESIFQSGPDEFVIEWTDGALKRYDLAQVENRCPCTRCASIEKPLNAEISVKKIVSVGRYGVKFEFNGGCTSGIYSYELLRSI